MLDLASAAGLRHPMRSAIQLWSVTPQTGATTTGLAGAPHLHVLYLMSLA